MFTLETKSFPTSSDELAGAIAASLRKWVDHPRVAVNGVYPALESVRIDLSGATIDARVPPPDVRAVGSSEPGPTVQRFALVAKPVRVQGAAAEMELTATKARFSYARNRAGQPLVLLEDAADGRLSLNIAQRDLEAAALFAAQAAAQPHGIAVQRVDLSLASTAPRALDVTARVTAKKLVTAIIRLTGRASIDDQLNATLSNLSADGDGMVAKIVVGLLRPHLQKLEGQQHSLLALPVGSLRLRDLQINCADGGVNVTSRFMG